MSRLRLRRMYFSWIRYLEEGVTVRGRVDLRGNGPLAVVIAGFHLKAYLIANLALNDGPQAAAQRYRLELATLQAAMAFYDDNETAIHDAIQAARKLDEQLVARSAQSVLAEMRARKHAPGPRNDSHTRRSINLCLDTIAHWPA